MNELDFSIMEHAVQGVDVTAKDLRMLREYLYERALEDLARRRGLLPEKDDN